MNKEGKIGGIINGWLILRAIIVFLITSVVTVLIFGITMYFLELNYEYAPVLGTVSVALGIFFSACSTAKKLGKKGFLIGLATALITFAFVTVISLILDDGSMTINTLFHLIIYTLAGLLGGILGVNKKQNKKYI